MMHTGSMGEGDKGGSKKPPRKDKLQLSVCDMPNDDFKKTWLTLKELYDKDLHRLQAKLTSLRKQRLADKRWKASIAKIKELTEQQKVLNATINNLKEKLKSKTCLKCTMKETYMNSLQQQFYGIQQRNLRCMAELTAERNQLREENKILSEKLKLTQQQFCPFSDSDDVPCTQSSGPVFPVRGPSEGHPVKLTEPSNAKQTKSGGEKEQQPNPNFSIPLHSPELFDVSQTSSEKMSLSLSKSNLGSISEMKPSPTFPSMSGPSFQMGHGFQVAAKLSANKPAQLKISQSITQKTSPKPGTQVFSWSLSSIFGEQNRTTQVVSETSEENMPSCNGNLFFFLINRKETHSSNVFPSDYSDKGKNRSSVGIPRCSTGLKEGSSQAPSNEQSTLRKNTNESTTGAAGCVTDKPQSDRQGPISECGIKRKARIQSGKKRK